MANSASYLIQTFEWFLTLKTKEGTLGDAAWVDYKSNKGTQFPIVTRQGSASFKFDLETTMRNALSEVASSLDSLRDTGRIDSEDYDALVEHIPTVESTIKQILDSPAKTIHGLINGVPIACLKHIRSVLKLEELAKELPPDELDELLKSLNEVRTNALTIGTLHPSVKARLVQLLDTAIHVISMQKIYGDRAVENCLEQIHGFTCSTLFAQATQKEQNGSKDLDSLTRKLFTVTSDALNRLHKLAEVAKLATGVYESIKLLGGPPHQ